MAAIPVASFSAGNLQKKMRRRHLSSESDSSTPAGSPTSLSFMESIFGSSGQHTQAMHTGMSHVGLQTDNAVGGQNAQGLERTPTTQNPSGLMRGMNTQHVPSKSNALFDYYFNTRQITKPLPHNENRASMEPTIPEDSVQADGDTVAKN